MKRKQKSLIFSILGALGVVLIFIYMWGMFKEYRLKTFKDPDGVFSIKYPANWTVQMNVGGAATIFISPKENDMDSFKESVNIVVQDLSRKPVKLSQYSSAAIDQMRAVFGSNFDLLESDYYFMSGLPGHKIVFIGKGPDVAYKYKIIWTIKDNTAYQVTYTADKEKYDKYITKINLMMASFKILK